MIFTSGIAYTFHNFRSTWNSSILFIGLRRLLNFREPKRSYRISKYFSPCREFIYINVCLETDFHRMSRSSEYKLDSREIEQSVPSFLPIEMENQFTKKNSPFGSDRLWKEIVRKGSRKIGSRNCKLIAGSLRSRSLDVTDTNFNA